MVRGLLITSAALMLSSGFAFASTPATYSATRPVVRTNGIQMTPNRIQRLRRILAANAALHLAPTRAAIGASVVSNALPPLFQFDVVAKNFDGYDTEDATTYWLANWGCISNGRVATYGAGGSISYSSYTDPACLSGDPSDTAENYGFLMNKTGPTSNFAAAQAEFVGIYEGRPTTRFPSGVTLTELGYDLRVGSHCGPAPYYVISDTNHNTAYVGCNTLSVTSTDGGGWQRMRITTTNNFGLSGTIASIYLVMDEGTDLGTGFTGHDILDNFDINGTLRGRP